MSQDIEDYFHKSFQKKLIAHVLRCPALLTQLELGKFTPDDVDLTIHRQILAAAKEVLKINNGFNPEKCIPINLLFDRIQAMYKAGIIREGEWDAVLDDIDYIYYGYKDLDPDYFFNILGIYLSETRIAKLIKNHKGKSAQDFASQVNRIVSDTHKKDGCIVVNPLMEIYTNEKAIEMVPCGISSLDSRLSGGLGKKELGIVCGITGLGKTTMGVNFTWGAAVSGRKGLMISLEIPYAKLCQRLYSMICQIPYQRVMHGDNGNMDAVNAEIREKMSQIPQEIRRNFQIWDYSDESCCLADIDRRLEALPKEEKPDMVFLDWLDALETDPTERQNGYVSRELRHTLQAYSKGSSDIAKKHDIAMWAATQTNAKADGQRAVRTSNAAEGFGKSWRCSVFLGMGATDQDRDNGRITVKSGKMRDGRIFETQIQARLDYQTFEDVPPDMAQAAQGAANFTPVRQRNTTTTNK